ncbi:chitinase-3-like protein 2 isoform X2 [Hippocampus zosterae]|uniref:chitinase-3-like protein 2 isoform X2 n=2 Tax=Hippocampus zosterae TaxID=109293 RepID=UPI00223E832D|nr:chitinase-3-like protein 2 isoform X2 [Hippocampus zosterae]
MFESMWQPVQGVSRLLLKANTMHKTILFAGLLLATAWLGKFMSCNGSTERLVCVYNSVSDQRWGVGNFTIDDIQPHLCTHLIYSFVTIDSSFNISPNSSDKIKFPRFKNLKTSKHVWSTSNPDLKILLEVNLMEYPFLHQLIATQENRKTFIQSVISVLREPAYMFDGINILWQAKTQTLIEIKEQYAKLIQESHEAFIAEAAQNASEKLLLTMSVSAQPVVIHQSYEVEHIADHIDFFNVMTSDIEIIFQKGQPSFATPAKSFSEAAFAVNVWHKLGVPAHKINMGIGVFGESFMIDILGTVHVVRGNLADLPEGFLSRYEVCSFLQGLLGASSTTQVVFDDIASIDAKVDYIKKYQFGGVFVLSLDLDDFNQSCCSHDSKYPVIQHLHDELIL